MTSKTVTEHVVCFPCPFLFEIYTCSYISFTFHWFFQFFSSRQLKRYLKLLLVYFYFSFAIWVSSCQTRQQHCCFCNGRWLRSKWLVLGLKWGSQFRIPCHHPAGNLVAHAMGCWLHGSSQSGLTSALANNEVTKPIHTQKKLPQASRDKDGLWSSQTLASGGRWLFGCFGSACPHSEEGCFGPASDSAPACEDLQILTSSEAASALAVAASAKPLQHQASCFRLSKLLWLVLTLFRLLTLKLHYLLSQLLCIAGRDGLFAKIGIGWGGLKRQGKDFGFLVATWNLPMGWI